MGVRHGTVDGYRPPACPRGRSEGSPVEKAVAAAPTEPVRELTIAGLQATLEVAEAALREERSRREVAEAKLEASEEERRALSTRLLSSVEARLEAAEGRNGALEGLMEARADSRLPDLQAVVSAAETASASAARHRAAGRACCSV